MRAVSNQKIITTSKCGGVDNAMGNVMIKQQHKSQTAQLLWDFGSKSFGYGMRGVTMLSYGM